MTQFRWVIRKFPAVGLQVEYSLQVLQYKPDFFMAAWQDVPVVEETDDANPQNPQN
jgi:hypothetical protein